MHSSIHSPFSLLSIARGGIREGVVGGGFVGFIRPLRGVATLKPSNLGNPSFGKPFCILTIAI